MDALLMCGGRGTRLDTDREKPLVEVGGRPMIDAVLAALAESRVTSVTAVVSPATPRTAAHLDTHATDVATVEAPGDGYVQDLQYALAERSDVDSPVLTVVADVPLLEGAVVDEILDQWEAATASPSLTVCVPAALKAALGASVETTREGGERSLAPTGLNVVAAGDRERTTVSWDARLAVNVNRRSDVDLAEALS